MSLGTNGLRQVHLLMLLLELLPLRLSRPNVPRHQRPAAGASAAAADPAAPHRDSHGRTPLGTNGLRQVHLLLLLLIGLLPTGPRRRSHA